MQPLYRDSRFKFHFADNRIIPRFHLEGIERGCFIAAFKIDSDTGQRLELLATASASDGGWVDLPQPIIVKAGEEFIAVPMQVRPEVAADFEAIRQINCLAFGQEGEARLVDGLRADGYARVSLVAEIDQELVGHILFSEVPIQTDTGTVSALALAPLAVAPRFQRKGIGSVLVHRGLEACREHGHRIVVVLGNPNYYPRFGFSAKLAEQLQSTYVRGSAHMAAELAPGALEGVVGKVLYPPPFSEL